MLIRSAQRQRPRCTLTSTRSIAASFLIVCMTTVVCSSIAVGVSADDKESNLPSASSDIRLLKIEACHVSSGSFRAGEEVRLSIALVNSASRSVQLDGIGVQIRELTSTAKLPLVEAGLIQKPTQIQVQGLVTDSTLIWRIPDKSPAGAYGIFVSIEADGQKTPFEFQTFFRVVDPGMLTCYEIDRSSWSENQNVYQLDGGMSAEYVVEKSIEATGKGISHTWRVSAPGSGPNPVYATPEFLKKSVQSTIDFYDREIGKNTPIETVIISTGVPSLPYLSATMRAPVLPVHYLVAFDSVEEVQGILRQAAQDGYPAYATAGQDSSVALAVAWIKLLEMPQPYLDFLKRHHVANVLILGSTGRNGGENMARRLAVEDNGPEPYSPGSIYVMYTSGDPSDATALRDKITNFDELELEKEAIGIPDWESGILEQQIRSFATSVKGQTTVSGVWSVTAEDLLELYNLGTYASLAFIQKNRGGPEEAEMQVRGVCLNPYLISHPLHELRAGYVPLLYWQGNPAASTVGRVHSVVITAVNRFLPNCRTDDLVFHINSSRNCGGAFAADALKQALIADGITKFKENDYSIDEVWDPTDGVTAPCECVAQQDLASDTAVNIRQWYESLKPLAPKDIEQLSSVGKFVIERQ